jgi:adhesin HecA-like repeat protein
MASPETATAPGAWVSPAGSAALKGTPRAEILRTARGDPGKLEPRTISFDLSRWAGQKVRLRFAQVDNRGPLRAGVDDVRLEAVGG